MRMRIVSIEDNNSITIYKKIKDICIPINFHFLLEKSNHI